MWIQLLTQAVNTAPKMIDLMMNAEYNHKAHLVSFRICLTPFKETASQTKMCLSWGLYLLVKWYAKLDSTM